MFFAGLAKAFGEGLQGVHQENARKAEIQDAQENAVLQHLTTSDDPEIAASAVTGLMAKAQGKPSKGLGRFFQDTKAHPAFATIQQLMQAGRPQQVQVPGQAQTVPAEPQGPPQGATPGASGSMAMPAKAAVEPGAQPLSVSVVESGPPGPSNLAGIGLGPSKATVSLPGPTQTRTQMVPRKVFNSPADEAQQKEVGSLQGKLSVFRQAQNPQEQALIGGTALRPTTGGYSYPKDQYGGVTVLHNGEVVDYIPAVATPQAPPKATGQAATDEEGGRRLNADRVAKGLAPLPDQDATNAYRVEARTAEQTKQTQAATAAGERTTLTRARLEEMAGNILRTRQATSGTTPPNVAQSLAEARQELGVNALPGQIEQLALEIQRQGGVLAGRGAPPAPTPGAPAITAPPAPGGNLPADRANLANFKRGKPNAQEQSTLDTIAGARPMMDRIRGLIQGKETQNSWGDTAHALGQAGQAWVGHNPSDPIYQELEPLITHLKYFATSPYLHGIRNGAFVNGVMQNTPTVTDTPARITAKLNNLDKTFQDIESGVGATQSGGPPAPVGATPATANGGPLAPSAAPLRQAIPGVPGGIAESLDGGKTWKRVK